MRGTSSAECEVFAGTEQLPPDALALLDTGGIFTGKTWWNVVISHAMPRQSKPAFLAISLDGHIAALVPMLRTGATLSSLTTPYSCEYTPLFAPGLDQAERRAAMTIFARACRSYGIVRLDGLPLEWDGLADLQAGARRAGLHVLRFDHFGNWYEDVEHLDWSAYLLHRPGALRETIRRRLRRAEKLEDARFEILTQPAQMDQAAEAFESVYRRSWKDAEPYPTFNVALMRATSSQGMLRLGVWAVNNIPVAVQFWVIQSGRALVLKLAHDEAYKAHSPGTVLTALMLRHLLDQEHVTRIDFGRGDDPYKQGWATQRQQRIGLLLVNPWTVSGATTLLRHGAGRVRTSLALHARRDRGLVRAVR